MKYTIVKTTTLELIKATCENQAKAINTLNARNTTQGKTIAERGKEIISLEEKIAEYETLVNTAQARIWELEQNKRDNHGCLLRNKQQK